jgi:uncharacterized MAPEG superfamily protein
MASRVLNTLLGWDVLPAWFALGALPFLHAASYAVITTVLLPWMSASGLQTVQSLIQTWAGTHAAADRLALWAVFVSLALHLLTFYAFLILLSADGVDNAYPRRHRPTDGTAKGRLYACHLNQVESFPGFAAAVLAAVTMSRGSAVAPIAWLHVAFRLAYWAFYAGNIPNLRTIAYIGSFQSTVMIFLEALN